MKKAANFKSFVESNGATSSFDSLNPSQMIGHTQDASVSMTSKKSKMSRIMNGHYMNTKSSFYSSFYHTNNSKNLSRDDSNFDIEIADPEMKRD